MKTLILATAICFSNFAFGWCDVVEDPPVNGATCQQETLRMPVGGEWTEVSHNASANGLYANGSLSVTATVDLTGSSALVAKVTSRIAAVVSTEAKAVDQNDVWVDVLLKQDSSGQRLMELKTFRYVGGSLQMVAASADISLGSAAITSYQLAYTYATGGITINIKNASGSLLASQTIANFGNVLPMVTLRRGPQTSSSGVASATFETLNYSSN